MVVALDHGMDTNKHDDTITVLRFLTSRMAALSRANREEIQSIVDAGEVTLADVVEKYIEIIRKA